ncbi:sigma-54 interaction domain-containing protein [Anoxynatronum buryatiense]|uniref:Transcriptional regulator containing PAS, AAA-type ATPase, and DNA-binding Fis domains n=1 Tax=Anoxynatronum buryatiense TaxID=489973 RepID=A0AA46AHM3_9CLOT|nr:sigma 54-interacting transcriptional regulator [Anoxynatronum buryatiense]SMP40929.1 Transcriptional regulator containing PAS, AAA-type ATPase, and DNA-binding Fis domains [Anoxynatronum buryatiense]
MFNERADKHLEKLFQDIPKSLFDELPLPINIVDENGIVVVMNQAFLNFYGAPDFKNALGRPLLEFDHTTRLPIVLKTGIPEVGIPHHFATGKVAVVDRIPIFDGDQVIGAAGMVVIEGLESHENAKRIRESIIQSIRPDWDDNTDQRNSSGAKYHFDHIITQSPLIKHFKDRARSFAATDLPVLITGESGVGKELFAQSIHHHSDRRSKPFVSINCAAIPETLLESELFGYEAGAFTGASRKGKLGKFELANHGTLFLDEIGDLPLSMQSKLLRVLQENQVERIGGNEVKSINVRVISATNRNLHDKIKTQEFRSDLYYRLNVLNLNIPALRERVEDIELLIEHFSSLFYQKTGIYRKFSPEVIRLLSRYPWPGNIRELENIVCRIIVIAEGEIIGKELIPEEILQDILGGLADSNDTAEMLGSQPHNSLAEIIKRIEVKIIEDTLEICDNNKSKAAELLGIDRMTLYRKLKAHDR